MFVLSVFCGGYIVSWRSILAMILSFNAVVCGLIMKCTHFFGLIVSESVGGLHTLISFHPFLNLGSDGRI